MNNDRRAMAVGCALAGLILSDGFSTPCAAQAAKADASERLQYLEWCQSSETDISYELVIFSCSELIELGKEPPKNLAVAFTNRGNGYVLREDYARAIADYTEAIRLDPNSVAAYFGRAGAHSDQGDVDRALADYSAARRLALKNGGDRSTSETAIAAVNVHAPVPAATALAPASRTNVGEPNAKPRPIVPSSPPGNAYPVLDMPDREPVVESRQPAAAADAAARPSFKRADSAAAPAPAPAPAAAARQPGFLLPESNVRYLTPLELQKLSAEQLQIARNEIFARRGRYFKDERLSSYFAKFAWYQPAAWDVPLNPIEQANVTLIQSLEAPSTPSIVGRPGPSTKPKSGTVATGTVP
jgi:tetratricopeptide (TPR) repeat protein